MYSVEQRRILYYCLPFTPRKNSFIVIHIIQSQRTRNKHVRCTSRRFGKCNKNVSVALCVFGVGVRKAMKYYKSKGNLMLKESEETTNFIEFWNNLFDNFNRTLPWQGL